MEEINSVGDKFEELVIDLKIYPFKIIVYFGTGNSETNIKNLNQQLPKKGCHHATVNNNWKGSCFEKSDFEIGIILYNILSEPLLLITTIRHEVQHACNMIWESIKESNYDSEALLYLNDYIFKEIVKHVTKNFLTTY